MINATTHRIEGTRTTVYHLLDYVDLNWPPEKVARYVSITVEQYHAGMKFIEEHKPEVMARYQKMLDRDAQGNSPEVEAILARNRARFLRLKEELQARACAHS